MKAAERKAKEREEIMARIVAMIMRLRELNE